MSEPLNCTYIPSSTPTDAGVAGAGTLLSFIITAFLALIFSISIVISESRLNCQTKVLRKLLLSFSDQQLLTGIGIQTLGLAKMHTMVPYHFFIIWMLSLLSTCTHISALLALVNDFKRDWVLRWLRQGLAFVNLCLSIASGIFILLSVMRDLEPTLPIACVWEVDGKGSPGNAALSIVGTIAVMAGQVLFFNLAVWYLHVKDGKWVCVVQLAGLLTLFAIGIGAAVRVILASQAFGSPSVTLDDTGEKQWGFGQLLALGLLLLPLVSAVEIMRGEMKVPSPVVDDTAPLLVEKGRQSFQPNPFWGTNESRSFGKY